MFDGAAGQMNIRGKERPSPIPAFTRDSLDSSQELVAEWEDAKASGYIYMYIF